MSKSKITGKVLAIQLGRNETQIILTDSDSRILHGITVDTPAGAVEDGMIRNPDAVRDMLKAALKTPAFKGVRQAVFTLCTSQVLSEVVTTPDLPISKMGKLLEANMDMYFPVDVQEYRTVWQVIGPKNGNGSLKERLVHIWAVPNSMLSRYYTVANACGLSVKAIDYCGNSIATAVGASFTQTGKTSKERKKVDLNKDISFGKKKKEEPEAAEPAEEFQTDRTVETDLHILLDEDVLGLTFVQAGKVVFQRFLRCGSDPSYQLGEVAMMVEYFHSMDYGRGAEINVIVSGGLSTDGAMVLELADVLGLPVSLLETNYDPKWILCAGASHTELDFGIPTLNSVVDTRTQMKSHLWQYGLVLAGALAVLAVVMMLLTSRLNWNTELATLNNTSMMWIERSGSVKGYADKYNDYTTLYNAYESDWDTIFSSLWTYNDNLVQVMEELEEMLPEDVTVTLLDINPTGLSVSFASENKEQAAYTIMKLRELEFADVAAVSDLAGGGRGAATSYGSEKSEETPPEEGGSVVKADMALVDQEKFLETVIFLPDDQFEVLKASQYTKTPESSVSLEELKTAADLNTRHAALEVTLKTNPFAMLRFKELVMEDLQRLQSGGETILVNYILFDLLPHQDKLTNTPKTLAEMYDFIDILLDAIEGEEYKIAATEKLLCQDSSAQAAYNHYLEVQAGQRAYEAYPYLNTAKISLDNGFMTGNSGLNAALNALFPVEEVPDDTNPIETVPPTVETTSPTEETTSPTEETTESTEPTKGEDASLSTEDVYKLLDLLLPDYVNKGASGYPVFDTAMDNFFVYGNTLSKDIPTQKVDSYIAAGKMDSVLSGLIYNYINNVYPPREALQTMLVMYHVNGDASSNTLLGRMSSLSVNVAKLIADELAAMAAKLAAQNTGSGYTYVDTRVHFAVVLNYKNSLRTEEMSRKGLSYADKVERLEVGD